MAKFEQNQAPVSSYAATPAATGYPSFVAPPPAAYPMKNEGAVQDSNFKAETKSRGDGFFKGCCAALCCCCMLDVCF